MKVMLAILLAFVILSNTNNEADAKSFNCKQFWSDMDRWSGGASQ